MHLNKAKQQGNWSQSLAFGDCFFSVSRLPFLKSPTWTTDPSEEEQGSGTGILERSGQVFSG